MRNWSVALVCLISTLTTTVALADSVTGFFSSKDGHFFLASDANGSNSLEVKTFDPDTLALLQRLATGDYIEGSGKYADAKLILGHVDFVGLKALIGKWSDSEALFFFSSFTSVTANIPAPVGRDRLMQYAYSIAPAAGNSWRIFFSDSVHVNPALLTVSEGSALIQFFNPETGDASLSVPLTKNASP